MAIGEAKFPVVHFRAAAEPFVRPRVNENAGGAPGERSANLPVERLRLDRFTVSKTVQANLRHDQRSVAGNVVQAGKIGIEAFLRFEIDVETGKIEEWELKGFRGRIIDVGHKAVRVLRLHSE